jgi:endo-1,4-beta-mannosidase
VVSGGKPVESGYMDPYYEKMVIEAQKFQLRTIVKLLKDHNAVYCWNLGNEPDLFVNPSSDLVVEKWAADMASVIHAMDPVHPVTCGLHMASWIINNGLQVDQVFVKLDIAEMHSYPMYFLRLAREPLDTEYVLLHAR